MDEVEPVRVDLIGVQDAAARHVWGVQISCIPQILVPHGLAGLDVGDGRAFLARVRKAVVHMNVAVCRYERY